jgi:hypothetical protein
VIKYYLVCILSDFVEKIGEGVLPLGCKGLETMDRLVEALFFVVLGG